MTIRTKQLCIFAALLSGVSVAAQNIRNDTIFVSTNAVVELKFPDKAAGILPQGDGSYEVGGSRKSLTVKALKNDAKPQPLMVTEGPRKHRYVLMYADKAPKLIVDWSKIRALRDYVNKKQQAATKELEEAHKLYAQGALEASLAKYQWILREIDENQEISIKIRIEEVEKQLQVKTLQKYTESMAKGNRFLAEKKYAEAYEAFTEALTASPDDDAATKKWREAGVNLFEDYIKKAEKASSAKNYAAAKDYYEAARELNKENFKPHLKRYDAVVKNATNLLCEQLLKKGNDAMAVKELDSARAAYDAVLRLKPDDKAATTNMKKVNEELAKRAEYRKREAEYYSVLSRAKNLADKASNEKDIIAAIEVYKNASGLFPDRRFPKDKIAALQRKKNTASAKN